MQSPSDCKKAARLVSKITFLDKAGTSIVEHTTMFDPWGLDVYSIGDKRYAVVAAEATITTTKEVVGVNGTVIQETSVERYPGVNIVDISDPTNVHIEGRIQDGAGLLLDRPRDIATYSVGNRHYAVVAGFGDSGVQIIDVTDPANPTAAGNIQDTNNILLHAPYALDVYSKGDKHYAAVMPRTHSEAGIQILDITDPANPTAAGKLTDTKHLNRNSGTQLTIHNWNDRYYAVTTHNLGKVYIVDVTDPDNPVAQAQLIGSYGSISGISAQAVDTFSIGDRHYAVVGTFEDGVIVFEMAFLTADAGSPQTVTAGDTITLDGSHSITTPGKTPTYKWEHIHGLPITISDSTAQSPTFVAPPSQTTLTLQLTITIPKSTTNLGAVGTLVSDIVSTDTVTIYVGGAPTTTSIFGAAFAGQIETTPAQGGGTHLGMSLRYDGDSATFEYSLLEDPGTRATVSFHMGTVDYGFSEYGHQGYFWNHEVVRVSPQTLTFTGGSNGDWGSPQTVTVTAIADEDNTPEQVIVLVIVDPSHISGGMTGIHVKVDDPCLSCGTAGDIGALGPPVQESPQIPVILLEGQGTMTIPFGSTWVEPGYAATGGDGADLTNDVVVSGMVDTSSEGTYFLVYTVADGSGVPAQDVRTVHVAPPEQIQQQPQQQPQQEAVPEPEQEPTEPEQTEPEPEQTEPEPEQTEPEPEQTEPEPEQTEPEPEQTEPEPEQTEPEPEQTEPEPEQTEPEPEQTEPEPEQTEPEPEQTEPEPEQTEPEPEQTEPEPEQTEPEPEQTEPEPEQTEPEPEQTEPEPEQTEPEPEQTEPEPEQTEPEPEQTEPEPEQTEPEPEQTEPEPEQTEPEPEQTEPEPEQTEPEPEQTEPEPEQTEPEPEQTEPEPEQTEPEPEQTEPEPEQTEPEPEQTEPEPEQTEPEPEQTEPEPEQTEPEPEQTEPEPEQTEPEPEQTPRSLPAIVQRYDSNGSGVIESGEWEVAIADYTDWKLTTPQIQTIAAHRG